MFQITTLLPKDGDVSKIPVKPKTSLIDYNHELFEKETSLTVSGQLAVENYACALTNVYTFGPTFRAENSKTTRHLAEFWMIEPEICFAGLNDLFCLIEQYIKYQISYCLANVSGDLEYFNKVYKGNKKEDKDKTFKDLIVYLEEILEKPFNKLSYTEAIEVLE